VDKYVELKNKQIEIAENADKIKDELVKYCQIIISLLLRESEYIANVCEVKATNIRK